MTTRMFNPLSALSTLTIGLGLSIIFLPCAAVSGMAKEAGTPLLQWSLAKYLTPHLLGPATALMVAVAIRFLLHRELQIPKWLVIVGSIGAVASISSLRGGYAHDFSHYVCDSCTGYGTIILSIASTTAISFALIHVLQQWQSRSFKPNPTGL